MNEPIHTEQLDHGFTVEIHWDDTPESPRTAYDNASRILAFHRNYQLSDVDLRDEPNEECLFDDAGIEPRCSSCGDALEWDDYEDRWAHESGEHEKWRFVDGVWMTVGDDDPPMCGGTPVDVDASGLEFLRLDVCQNCSGCSISINDNPNDFEGFVYMTEAMIRECYGVPVHEPLTDEHRAWARELMEGEVQTYNAYLQGEVYGWVVENAEGDTIESCWGYYGDDEIEYMLSEARAVAQHEIDKIEAEEASALVPVLLASEAA